MADECRSDEIASRDIPVEPERSRFVVQRERHALGIEHAAQ
jgi:hypothetical protein